MTQPFTILAPDLDTHQTRLLRAALTSTHLAWTALSNTLADDHHVLSVGKAGLDVWHDFGLIKVGTNHGDLFTHRAVTGHTYTVMVLEHPGTLQQQSIVGHLARDNMVRDLDAWGRVLVGLADTMTLGPTLCGGCLKMREPKHRPAVEWVAELDGVGLCDDHYRRRASYRRKVPRVARKDVGKMESQIVGQMEAFPGDGTRLVVSKT